VSITNFCVAVALKRWEFQRFTNVSEIDGVRRAVYPSKKLLNLTVASLMEKYKIPLLDESGRTIGYGDRWWTHRVRDRPNGPILGQKHVGITIACLDDCGRVLVQHRRHRIFDKVWSLSGDTHPRKYESRRVESHTEAAKRCAREDLGVVIKNWTQRLIVPYSARDPRDSRYCENELLYILVAKHSGQLHMNDEGAYELQWVEPAKISKDSQTDLKREPIDRKYAPWVSAVFSLPSKEVEETFRR
jgi:isopentenyldiphosphate isomerase